MIGAVKGTGTSSHVSDINDTDSTGKEMNHGKTPVLILGTGTFAVEVFDLLSDTSDLYGAAFVENMDREKCKGTIDGIDILWVEEIAPLSGSHLALCALGTTHRSLFTDQVEKLGFSFATLVHPRAAVSGGATIGDGTIVGRGAVISTHTRVGKHVLINRGALVGHHTEIGDFVTINPGANIAGCCVVKNAAYIGIGAVIIDHLTVGSSCIVGAGAVVTRDVPDRVQVVGVPAKITKTDIGGK